MPSFIQAKCPFYSTHLQQLTCVVCGSLTFLVPFFGHWFSAQLENLVNWHILELLPETGLESLELSVGTWSLKPT